MIKSLKICLLVLTLAQLNLSTCGLYCSECEYKNGQDQCKKCVTNVKKDGKCEKPSLQNCYMVDEESPNRCDGCDLGSYQVSRNDPCTKIPSDFPNCISISDRGGGLSCNACDDGKATTGSPARCTGTGGV